MADESSIVPYLPNLPDLPDSSAPSTALLRDVGTEQTGTEAKEEIENVENVEDILLVDQAEEEQSESSLSAPDPDDEKQDPDWKVAAPKDLASPPSENTRKRARASNGSNGTPAKRQKGSAKTRELERRLRAMEGSMDDAGSRAPRRSTRGQGKPSGKATVAAKFEEYESINSDRRVCYDCYKEEEHNTEFMLSHCWKHPWWEMIADGSCETCGSEKQEIVWGIQALRARGRMDVR
ncbi:MAG: hypothetical protein LQ340_002514 [Diploschistes diacapsis]|nr:MAG: hypothetical protein LQ340_002514 [Diploschistes diacapsis]